MTEEDRIYTVSAEPPQKEFGKTYVRIPYDIREEVPIDEEHAPPEGMKIYSYLEVKYTHPQYSATLPTREDMELADAETLINAYEAIRGD